MNNTFYIKGRTALIALKRKKGGPLYAIIDRADLDKARGLKGSWVVKWNPTAHTFYARANGPEGYLHRFLLSENRPQIQIDHRDHNGLNNRRRNLKPSNRSENAFNRRGCQTNSTSKRRNVYWNRRERKWMVWLTKNGVRRYAGYFSDLEEADKVAKKLRAA